MEGKKRKKGGPPHNNLTTEACTRACHPATCPRSLESGATARPGAVPRSLKPGALPGIAVGFGLVMMGVFFPGLYYATQGYDVKPPAPAYLVMATLFGGIALSGFLHLDAAKARSD